MITTVRTKSKATWLKAIVAILLMFPFFAIAQDKLSCSDLKAGNFYVYPKNSSDRYLYEREGTYQKETNLSNGDTNIYKITWKKDCSYTIKYISGGKNVQKETIAFFKDHELFCEIDGITSDYYLYSAYVDKKSTIPVMKDTMWLHEKAVVKNNELFKQYPTRVIPKKDHFSDTSKYAVLYLYRPGKLTNSLGTSIIYFDENLMWAAQNNAGSVFKILKEGKYRITSRLLKDESFVDVDFKFGQTYYVKATMKWGFYHGRNFKLGMELVPADTGVSDFSEVDFK